MLDDILLRVQRFIAAYLAMDEGLTDVPVISSRTDIETDNGGSVQDIIEGALAGLTEKNGKSGAALVVLMPDVAPEDPNLPGPQMDLEISVRAVENRLINEGAGGTGLSAPRLAVHVARLLHQWSPDGVNVLRPAQRLIEDISVPDREMHEVRFRMRLPIASMTRTPAPMLEGVEVEDGVTVAMSCAMPGAQILYSLDENFPATPYTEPVLITEPAVVSAVAIAPGLIVSRVSTAKISPT